MSIVVEYDLQSAPLNVLIESTIQLGSVTNANRAQSTTTQANVEGKVLKGLHTVLRYLARVQPDSGLYGKSAIGASQVDEWLDLIVSPNLAKATKEEVSGLVDQLESHLHLRSFLADYRPTIADLSFYYHLTANPSWEGLSAAAAKKVNFGRWFEFIRDLSNSHSQGSAGANKALAKGASGKSKAGSQGNFNNLELPNAKDGEMVTRFPPEPSGYLHIGHAKAALMNNYYAQAYNGKLIIRFDDTNPSKEKEEYVDSILEDLKVMEITPSGPITYTSDYFDQIEAYCEQLLKSGLGYIDDTPVEKMRDERDKGIESKRRNESVEENLRRWSEMKKGSPEGVQCVVRAKIDMQCKNKEESSRIKVLRDPSMYRCAADVPHHRTGSKYKAYPLYDFACPIVDSLEGVTHALRSSEYHDRNPLYYWVIDALKLRKPFIQDFSRLNFSHMLLSKRKLQKMVDAGIVEGWDDPRFPTIRGLLRRGLTVEAIRDFILSQGASKSLNLMDVEKLWALNKKIIDPVIPRYTAIASEARALFEISDGPAQAEQKTVLKHNKNPTMGHKVITYTNRIWLEGLDAAAIKEGEEVTLMDWGNAIIEKIEKEGEKVVLKGRLNLSGDIKSTSKKLTWLSDISDLVPAVLVRYDHLLKVKKLLETDVEWLETCINQDSKHDTPALADPSLRTLKKGDRLQLNRRGYFIVDEPYVRASNPMVLIEIPDGHTNEKGQSVLTAKAPAATKN
ncbi:hypothetical protein PROFUN_08032 [Planoprotostelium fungivorum]|uniref:glutamate--tRNA ligase n=1 Tax=Planoprotostelium fungivorum TaxID=1890364 RepID=A0A2P6NKE7_9EUKA|nr:hypothetical protein PROFUN_08032 [Planoprotostelium fungivorum]